MRRNAIDHELIDRNVFARLGVIKRIRRIDRPDFQIITDQQYQRLQHCARASRTDSYGLILQGVILAIGEAALRPGEIFALLHSDVDFAAGVLRVRRQIDLDTGLIQWPKDDAPRDIVISPGLRGHLTVMPRLSEEILFPAPRGGYMRRSSWSAHWHSIRASALMPGLEFYELRHRALQWMIDPTDDGGLGLDIQTAAKMARIWSQMAANSPHHVARNLVVFRLSAAKEYGSGCNRSAITRHAACTPPSAEHPEKPAICGLLELQKQFLNRGPNRCPQTNKKPCKSQGFQKLPYGPLIGANG